jgi:hypothetical protein
MGKRDIDQETREREFVAQDIAKDLKELGFIEDCLAVYELVVVGDTIPSFRTNFDSEGLFYNHNQKRSKDEDNYWRWSAPLFQQAFRWLVEECGMDYNIFQNTDEEYYYQISVDDVSKDFEEYHEAQNACLREMLREVKNNVKALKA